MPLVVALLIGATSDIGRAIARRLAAAGYALQLAARVPAQLQADRCDLRLRSGLDVTLHRCDVLQPDGGVALVENLDPLADVAVCVVGVLGDQSTAQRVSAEVELGCRLNASRVAGAQADGTSPDLTGVSS